MRIRGRILKFDGFTKVLPSVSRKEDEVELPNFGQGDALVCLDTDTVQHFNQATRPL